MKKYAPPNLRFIENESDGASLPKLYRWILSKTNGPETLRLIDESGYYHDWLVHNLDFYRITVEEARNQFIIDLIENQVSHLIVMQIWLGIWIYDKCPDSIKKLLKRTSQ